MFKPVINKDDTKSVSVWLNRADQERLREHAKSVGLGMGQLAKQMILHCLSDMDSDIAREVNDSVHDKEKR